MSEFPNFHKRNKNDVKFPSFHKKNNQNTTIENVEKEQVEKEIEYPINFLLSTDGTVSYSKYSNYIELYEKGKYKDVLNLLLPQEGGGAGLTAIMTLTLGPAGFFAGRSLANENNRYISFVIASCYYKLGEYNNALNHLNKIRYWDWGYFYFLKAWTLYKLKHTSDAKEYFKKAFISRPKLLDYPCPVEVSLT